MHVAPRAMLEDTARIQSTNHDGCQDDAHKAVRRAKGRHGVRRSVQSIVRLSHHTISHDALAHHFSRDRGFGPEAPKLLHALRVQV